MILLAESGSTKTDWCLIGDEKRYFSTIGFNPLFVDGEIISKELEGTGLQDFKDQVERLIFFGAGIATDELKSQMTDHLNAVFTSATIEVYSDIEACAKALYSGDAIVTCILGTGSNACLYDGATITQKSPSLGYVLGDEGAGSWFGRQLLKDHLYGNLPEYLQDKLDELGVSTEEVITRVYKSERPNQYLASFFPLIAENREDKYCKELIRRGLIEFLDNHVVRYNTSKVGFVGGVANALKSELNEICSDKGLVCKAVIDRPLDVLVDRVEDL
jgi:N-acetylglucosamine kinase-like BadF-type ATPase